MRVHWMLHELDLPYQTFPIKARSGETQTDSYLDINPKGKIPTLVHDKFVLSEGFAILRYLSNLFSSEDNDHFQSSLEGQATYDEWASFILMELDATALYVIRRHRDLEEIYGHSSEAVSSAEKYFEKMLLARCRELDFSGYVWGNRFSEIDISIKANSMFIDSEGCMQCRRLFPVTRLQPTCDTLINAIDSRVPG